MTDDLERILRDIAEHKEMSVQLGHPRAMALARAVLAYRECTALAYAENVRRIDHELLKALQ